MEFEEAKESKDKGIGRPSTSMSDFSRFCMSIIVRQLLGHGPMSSVNEGGDQRDNRGMDKIVSSLVLQRDTFRE